MMVWDRFRINGQLVVLILVVVSVYLLFRNYNNKLDLPNTIAERESTEKPMIYISKETGGQIFLIPDDNTLLGMTETDLYLLFWRYTNTFQTLCRNTMRFGPIAGAGKDVCLDEEFVPHKPCLVYSLGSNMQFEFEEAVLALYGCEVHTFDPSIKITDDKRKKIPKGVIYHEIGIDGRNFVNNRGWTMRTLPTMIKDLHHENKVIDILKMDVEGGEWRGFQNDSDFKGLENAKQFIVELHIGRNGKSFWGGVSMVNQLKMLRTLYEKGFRICMSLQTKTLAKKLKTLYGTNIGTLTELTLLNPKWIRTQQ